MTENGNLGILMPTDMRHRGCNYLSSFAFFMIYSSKTVRCKYEGREPGGVCRGKHLKETCADVFIVRSLQVKQMFGYSLQSHSALRISSEEWYYLDANVKVLKSLLLDKDFYKQTKLKIQKEEDC